MENIIKEFKKIKELGFVKSNRPNNRDGGIGNTFEDYLGVAENNFKLPDFESFEIKSKRELNTSYTSLFCKSPNYPKKANTILKERFGEFRNTDFTEHKILYASIFTHRKSLIYEKFNMQLVVDKLEQKLKLIVEDIKTGESYNDVYWDFNKLERASSKIKSLFIVYAEEKLIDKTRYYHYNKAEIFLDFSFDKFLNALESGIIMFDIRIGVYNSGKYFGKAHDHGSGFRIKAKDILQLYSEKITVE